MDKVLKVQNERQQAFEAGKRLLAALKDADLNRDGTISLEEFRKTFVQVCVVLCTLPPQSI